MASSYDFGKGLALVASINFYPPFDRLLRYVIPKKILQRMLDHKAMTIEKVHKRLSVTEQRPDFINTITTQNEGRGEKAMTLKEIELNMSILVFAGSETTASALSGIMRMLLQNRTAMVRLNEEVRGFLQSGIRNYDGVCWTSEIPGCRHRRRHTTLSAFVSYRHPHPVKVEVSHVPWWNNTQDIRDRLGCQVDLDSVNLRCCPCFAIL